MSRAWGRALVVVAAFVSSGCRKRVAPEHAVPTATDGGEARVSPVTPAAPLSVRQWSFASGAKAVVLVPDAPKEAAPFPLVIALHGRGEALKGPSEGAWGWPRDYRLLEAISRVQHPPLVAADLLGFVDEPRLRSMNDELSSRPYRGLIVACAYVPDLNLQSIAELDGYADFVVNQLLPRLAAETPMDRARVGIDGVSLGGATALYVGLKYPTEFARVGAIQAAIGEWEVPLWAERTAKAHALAPNLAFRILTSSEDAYRDANRALSKSLEDRHIPHRFIESPGPHDCVFNRGPGAYELLFFHER